MLRFAVLIKAYVSCNSNAWQTGEMVNKWLNSCLLRFNTLWVKKAQIENSVLTCDEKIIFKSAESTAFDTLLYLAWLKLQCIQTIAYDELQSVTAPRYWLLGKCSLLHQGKRISLIFLSYSMYILQMWNSCMFNAWGVLPLNSEHSRVSKNFSILINCMQFRRAQINI